MNKTKRITFNIRFFAMRSLALLCALVPAAAYSEDGAGASETETLKAIALPLLCIDTEGAAEPAYTPVYAPEGCYGESITDNEYVNGRMVITMSGKVLYDSGDYVSGESGMRIRVRGNTSTTLFPQKPYKIKLSKKADLLFGEGGKYRNRNWALLSTQMNGNLTFTMAALQLARIAGVPWEPETNFVNVVLNGKYKGLYNLIETIERADSRVQTAESGFVIENDPYWWNEGEAYFKTTYQPTSLGYTFKYPKYEDTDERRVQQIQAAMQSAEDVLWSEEDASSRFDYPSFARWILVHDILGTRDATGSNIYYVMEDMGDSGETVSPLKAGPLWDFGSMLKCDPDSWSVPHVYRRTFMYPLFKRDAFVQEYARQFESVRTVVTDSLQRYMDGFLAENEDAIEKSIALDNPYYTNVGMQVKNMMKGLAARVATIERLLQKEYPTGISGVEAGGGVSMEKRVDLWGRDFTGVRRRDLPEGIYIERYHDGTIRKYKKM